MLSFFFFFFLIISFPFQFHIPYFAHHLQTYLFMKGKNYPPSDIYYTIPMIIIVTYRYTARFYVLPKKNYISIIYQPTSWSLKKEEKMAHGTDIQDIVAIHDLGETEERKEKEDPWRVSLLCAIRCSILLYYFFT